MDLILSIFQSSILCILIYSKVGIFKIIIFFAYLITRCFLSSYILLICVLEAFSWYFRQKSNRTYWSLTGICFQIFKSCIFSSFFLCQKVWFRIAFFQIRFTLGISFSCHAILISLSISINNVYLHSNSFNFSPISFSPSTSF